MRNEFAAGAGRARWASMLALLALMTLAAGGLPARARGEALAGIYCGEVWSGGRNVPVITVIVTDAGTISGRYEFAEDDGWVEGRLELRQRATATELAFTWRDRYGDGLLALRFAEDFSAFSGAWFSQTLANTYVWNGRRCHRLNS